MPRRALPERAARHALIPPVRPSSIFRSDAPRRGRFGVALVSGLALGLALGGLHCTGTGNAAIHQWGTYAACLQLQEDNCKAVDGGCFPSVTSNSVTLGVNPANGEAYYYRTPDAPTIGRQVGNHFEFITNTLDGGLAETICGCQAQVVETFYGELLPTVPEVVCPADAGMFGCDVPADAGSRPTSLQTPKSVPPIDWLDVDASIDPGATLPGFQGVSIDTLTVQPGSVIPDAGCPCLPCTVVYNLSGALAQ